MTTPLSSDILEAQFGPTSIDVLHDTEQERLIATTVVSSGQRLELSHVHFRQNNDEFQAIRQAMTQGMSMGKAFREAGVAFERAKQQVEQVALPASLQRWFLIAGEATLVTVTILAGDKRLPFADIFELYSPAVTWPEPAHRSKRQAITDELAALAKAVA